MPKYPPSLRTSLPHQTYGHHRAPLFWIHFLIEIFELLFCAMNRAVRLTSLASLTYFSCHEIVSRSRNVRFAHLIFVPRIVPEIEQLLVATPRGSCRSALASLHDHVAPLSQAISFQNKIMTKHSTTR